MNRIVAIFLAPAFIAFFWFQAMNLPIKSAGRVLGVETSEAKSDSADKIETYYAGPNFLNSADFFQAKNITVYPEDIVQVLPDLNWGMGGKIEVRRATPIAVSDFNKKTQYRTFSKTIGDFFDERSIFIGELDRFEPKKETAISENLEIKITRVEKTKVIEKEKIDYKTVRKEDKNMDKGTERIEKKGEKGARELTYEVIRENGKEVSKKLLEKKTTREPIDEIIIFGTKEVVYGEGTATWYASPAMTACHNGLARGTEVLVTNLANGKQVKVKIIGPGLQGSAIIDLSPDAFSQLAPLGAGRIQVRLTKP